MTSTTLQSCWMQVAKSRDMILCQIQIYNLVAVVHLMNFMGHGVALFAIEKQSDKLTRMFVWNMKKIWRNFNLSGSADGYIILWDVVRSKAITSMQAHSGPIVDILEIPTLNNCNGVVHPVIGKMFPPPTKNTLVSIGEDGIIKIWSAWRSGRLNQVAFFLAQPSNLTSSSQSWADSPASKDKTRRSKITSSLVVKGSRCLIIGYDNGCMQAWELQTDLIDAKGSKSLNGDDKVFCRFGLINLILKV